MLIPDLPDQVNTTQAVRDAYVSFQTATEALYQDVLTTTGTAITATSVFNYINGLSEGGIAGSVTAAFGPPWPQTGPAAQTIRFQNEFNGVFHAWGILQTAISATEGGSNLLGILPLIILGAGAVALAVGGAGAAAGAGAASGGTSTGTTAGAGAGAAGGASAGAGTGTTAAGGLGGAAAAGEGIGTGTGTAAGAGSAAGAGAAAGGAASSGAGSILSNIGQGASSLSSTTGLTSTLGDLVGGVSDLLSNIGDWLSPLLDFAKGVFQDIEALNKDVIQPIADTILKDYNTINGLINEVHILAQSGIQGILAIPDALGKAFTSLDASNQRLAQMTGDINKGIASDVLAPGIGGAIREPLANIHEVLTGTYNKPVPDVGSLPSVTLDEPNIGLDAVNAGLDKLTDELSKVPVLGAALSILLKGANAFFAAVASVEHVIEAVSEAGWYLNPEKKLDPDTVVRAWWRGEIDEKTARTEIQRSGIDATRQTLLYNLQRWLPAINDAVTMYYRHVITGDELTGVLTKQGLSTADMGAVLEAALDPVNPREAMDVDGKLAAAQAGFLPGTLTQLAPTQYSSLYGPKLSNPDNANLDWIEHWKLPDMSWWFQAYYKGLATQAEVELAARAANVPPEVIPRLLDVDKRQLSFYLIVQILDLGVLSEAEARDYLQYLGAADRDIDILIRYANAKMNGALPNDPLGLGKISEAQAKSMLTDGVINDSEFTEIVEAHGYTTQAAALLLNLTKQEIALTARKDYATGLIDQVLTGNISQQDFQALLGGQGYTSNEVANYTSQLLKAIAAKTKEPTTAEIEAFFKHGIMDQQTATTALQTIGWSPQYAAAFLQLWGLQSGTTTTGTTTAG